MIMEAQFKQALRELMHEIPLEDINVTLLCSKCGCHRQTFYYHYQDIYDLIGSIFLNEDIDGLSRAASIKDIERIFVGYCKKNYQFLKSIFNSAAQELSEQFIVSKIQMSLFSLLSQKFDANVARNASRRFAKIVADETSFILKDKDLSSTDFEKKLSTVFDQLTEYILPALISMAKKEIL